MLVDVGRLGYETKGEVGHMLLLNEIKNNYEFWEKYKIGDKIIFSCTVDTYNDYGEWKIGLNLYDKSTVRR